MNTFECTDDERARLTETRAIVRDAQGREGLVGLARPTLQRRSRRLIERKQLERALKIASTNIPCVINELSVVLHR